MGRGQDSLSVGDIESCFTASPASEATSGMSPATHVGGASLSIIDEEEEHGRGLLDSSRQLPAVLEEEGESMQEEEEESTLTGEATDVEEEPNPQPSPSGRDPSPSPPGGSDDEVISTLSSSATPQQYSPEGSLQREEDKATSPPADEDSAAEHPTPGAHAAPLGTDLQTIPVNGK